MKKADFLSRLREEGKLELVEPSEAVKESYLIKADNCLKSAKILLQNDLYENSMGEAYYAMYNCVTALLYKAGIKSENHSASIILLGKLFRAWELKNNFCRQRRQGRQAVLCGIQPEEKGRQGILLRDDPGGRGFYGENQAVYRQYKN